MKKNPHLKNKIIITGFVSEKQRDELMARSHAILVPSLREGWGIIVTEAAAQNTTAIVYPSPGLMEAVDFGKTGLITREKNWEALFEQMKILWLNKKLKEKLTQKARTWAETFNWDIAANQCDEFLNNPDLSDIFEQEAISKNLVTEA